MVRVGEDQEILTLEPCHVRSWNGRQCSRNYPNDSKHHYGAEPSFHRSASQRNAALVLVRAYVTPEHVQNRLKTLLNEHRKGLTQYTHDQRFMTTHAVVCFVQIPQ